MAPPPERCPAPEPCRGGRGRDRTDGGRDVECGLEEEDRNEPGRLLNSLMRCVLSFRRNSSARSFSQCGDRVGWVELGRDGGSDAIPGLTGRQAPLEQPEQASEYATGICGVLLVQRVNSIKRSRCVVVVKMQESVDSKLGGERVGGWALSAAVQGTT